MAAQDNATAGGENIPQDEMQELNIEDSQNTASETSISKSKKKRMKKKKKLQEKIAARKKLIELVNSLNFLSNSRIS